MQVVFSLIHDYVVEILHVFTEETKIKILVFQVFDK